MTDDPTPAPGRVIVLNGTSSSGKSALAAELAGLTTRPFVLLRIDDFYALTKWPADPGDVVVEETLRGLRTGFHRTVAAMARAGVDVLVDQLFGQPWRLPDLLTALEGLDTVLVGVHCDPAELARREKERDDRPIGRAAAQLTTVHAHGLYDIEVDTTTASPRACAEAVAAYLADRPAGPSACARLRTPPPTA